MSKYYKIHTFVKSHKMKIDEKSIELGLTEEIVNFFHSKTKLSRFNIEEVSYNSIDYKNETLCFDIKINNQRRKYYTLHTTKSKIIKINRDILINKILD